MFEIISAIYTFWNYAGDIGKLKKIFFVFSKYFKFLKWYCKNPEVKIKYNRLFSAKKENNSIEKIYNALIKKGKKFGNSFLKTNNTLEFELLNSKWNYRVYIDELNPSSQNIIFETKYISFFPLRKFKKLNEITTEFNELYETISNPFKISQNNKTISVEIQEIVNKNRKFEKFEKMNAEISFKGNKIQINNYNGTEHGEFLLFFIMKWLTEYRIP
jgi:hypothetical protein